MKSPILALTIVPLLVAAPVQAAPVPAVSFSHVYFDSPGSDDRSNTSLNAEWVRLTNNTTEAIELRGWTVRDTARHVYTFRTAFRLGAAKSVVLHTGKGLDNSTNRYWQSGNYIWNNPGDTATLRDLAGTTIDTCTWKTGAETNC